MQTHFGEIWPNFGASNVPGATLCELSFAQLLTDVSRLIEGNTTSYPRNESSFVANANKI